MPATGTLLLLVAIWILINLFVGDLPKLIYKKAGFHFGTTPDPTLNPAPNPNPSPSPNPSANPNPSPSPGPAPRPDPPIPGVGPDPGSDGPAGGVGQTCPDGYMSVFGICVPIRPVPTGTPPAKPGPVPFPGFGPIPW